MAFSRSPHFRHARSRSRFGVVSIAIAAALALPASALAVSTMSSSVASAASIGSGDCVSEVTGTLVTSTSSGATCVVAFKGGTGTWKVPAGVTSVTIQMVGGGGGGGNFGGGGGGEAVLKGDPMGGAAQSVTSGADLTVTVGLGGAGGTAASPATNGGDSVFGPLTAKGGGGGGSTDSGSGIGTAGLSGGSGGGGAPNTIGSTGGAGGAATKADGDGSAGGSGQGVASGINNYLGGGGGGGAAGNFDADARAQAGGVTNGGSVDKGAGGSGRTAQRWFTLAVPILTRDTGAEFGRGGGGGCAAYSTSVTAAYSCEGGVNWFGSVTLPTSGAANGLGAGANSGTGGAGGGYFTQAGADGAAGVVLISWVPGGGGGGATGGPTVTPPSPAVANGTTPVVFDVAPTITAGTSPVNSGATCIVDPATGACGTRVMLPTQGTWVLDNTAGTLTFTALSTATPGATESVVLRVTDGNGVTGEGTFSVLIPDGSTRPKYAG